MILLEHVDTAFGTIRITSDRSGAVTYYQEECFQSQVDADGVSTCPYIHVMKDLCLSVRPERVLLIGGAGGSLATLLHRAGCAVTMVDVNAYAFTLARRYFQLPAEVECVEADGYAYLLESDRRFDAVAVDAFNARGVIPPQLRRRSFFRLLKEALGQGVMVMNVLTCHDLDTEADRIARTMEAAGLSARLYDWPGRQDRNTLLTGWLSGLLNGGAAAGPSLPPVPGPAWLQKELRGLTCRAPTP